MPVSRLDVIYRRILISKFFTRGWGCPEDLLRLFNFRKVVSSREACYKLVPRDYEISIIKEERHSDYKIIEGRFLTPLSLYVSNLVPSVKQVYFQLVIPNKWQDENYKPICIHLAGTGDHYFWRRRNFMAKPLLKAGIGSIILENPYYGHRKPPDQLRSSLHYVSDIFVMGGCLILESIALLNWCERLGFGPLGISGISMGGHMASLAASNWPKPLVLVPCLSWSTASSVFTEGVMSDSINWDMLQKQLFSNDIFCNVLAKSLQIVDSPFACTLSRIPEYGLDAFLDRDDNIIGYVSPHEMMNIFHSSNCSELPYKRGAKSEKNSLLNDSFIFRKNRRTDAKIRSKEAVWFMRGMMDEFTHLKNFSVPYDTSLIIAICASCDGYVPRVGVSNLEQIWPGSTVRYVDSGHVGAYLWHSSLFRNSIIEAFEKTKKLIPSLK